MSLQALFLFPQIETNRANSEQFCNMPTYSLVFQFSFSGILEPSRVPGFTNY